MMQRIEDAKTRLPRSIQNLQHMRNATIRFCNGPDSVPYLPTLGNEIVVGVDDEKGRDVFVEIYISHALPPVPSPGIRYDPQTRFDSQDWRSLRSGTPFVRDGCTEAVPSVHLWNLVSLPSTRNQAKRTFRSIVFITESRRPESTCLAMLSVKPSAVWKGTCDGNARAYGSTTASTTTGPFPYDKASARASLTSPGSSRRIPFAPIASATTAKFGFFNPVPNGTKPFSCCSMLTKLSDSLLKMI